MNMNKPKEIKNSNYINEIDEAGVFEEVDESLNQMIDEYESHIEEIIENASLT